MQALIIATVGSATLVKKTNTNDLWCETLSLMDSRCKYLSFNSRYTALEGVFSILLLRTPVDYVDFVFFFGRTGYIERTENLTLMALDLLLEESGRVLLHLLRHCLPLYPQRPCSPTPGNLLDRLGKRWIVPTATDLHNLYGNDDVRRTEALADHRLLQSRQCKSDMSPSQ